MFLTTLIIIIILLIFIILSINNKISANLSYAANWLGIFIYIYAIYTWKIVTHDTWFSPYFIFYTFFTIFNYGQCIMWALGIHIDSELGSGAIYYDSGIYVSESQLLVVKIFVCICMLLFHFGALLCYKPLNSNRLIESNKIEDMYKAVYIMGIILGIISIPITLYRAYDFFNIAKIHGYKSLYYSSYANQGGISSIIEIFFFPALVCLLIGSKYSKNTKRIVYFIFTLYLLLNLFSGDRGSWIYKIIILIWLSSKYYKPLKIRKVIFLSLVGIIGLYFVYAIVSVRNIGFSNINFLNVNVKQSPIVQSFFEMGGSMNIITYLLIVGNNIWPYGNSYLMAFLGMISTRIASLLGMPFVLVDNWFSQEYLGLDWGVGFSMVGEAYLNGGLYGGPLIVGLLGFSIASFISINKNSEPQNSPLRYFIVATSLNTLIGFSRGSIYLYLKTLFYGTIVISIIIIIIKNSLINKKHSILKKIY